MESLLLSLDPKGHGGVYAMQRAMIGAHARLGFRPYLAHVRLERRSRLDLRKRLEINEGVPTLSLGYVPTIEYLNYVAPALVTQGWVHRFPIVQVVSGSHAISAIPILARHPFVSWVATPLEDEMRSRFESGRPSMSVRLNHGLRKLNNALERWSYEHPRRVFTLSAYTARRLAQLTRFPVTRFEVLRFPIDLARFTPDGPKHATHPGRYVLSCGRVDDDRKNFPSLIRCFARIAASHPDVKLVIAGAKRTDNPVVELPRELGIADRVIFPGLVTGNDLAALYRGAEAYVMTSRQEGLGIVVLEAQASGLSCLIMCCGGSDELIDDGNTGWLVGQGDELEFTKRLDEILKNPDARRRIGAAARREVERSYSFHVFDRTIAAAYEDAFAVPPCPRT